MLLDSNRLAVIADVHGNRWALEAVLHEIGSRGIELIINLGDCVYGPLDPRGSIEWLMERSSVTISGNRDRMLHRPTESFRANR